MEVTISAQARLCHDLYVKCISAGNEIPEEDARNALQSETVPDKEQPSTVYTNSSKGPPLPNVLKNELGRFNIWTSNIGVFAELKLSMDYRLRDAPDIRILVVELLDSLRENLSDLAELLTDKTKPDKQSASANAIETTVKEQNPPPRGLSAAVIAVSSDVGRLHRLSNAIHRAGADTRNIRASKFILKDEEGNDIGPAWREHFALALCERQFRAASHVLLERLATTMLSRRKRLSYRQVRQEKLSIDTQRPEKILSRNLHKAKASSKIQQSDPILETKSHVEKSVTSHSVQTADTAATPLPVQHIRAPSVVSRISSAQSVRLDDETKIRFPPPPVAKDSADVVCPYCSLVLPVQRLTDIKWWRRHVVHDLDPYVCLEETCLTPEVLFSDEKAWIRHIRTEHRQKWHCAIRKHRNAGPTTFSTKENFEDHMRGEHATAFPENQLALISEKNARPVGPTFQFCPLCGPEVTSDIETGENEAASPMERHISNHLMLLALRSMPYVDSGGEDGLSDKTTRPKTRETVRDMFQTKEPWQEQDFAPAGSFPPLDESCDFIPDTLASGADRQQEWGGIIGPAVSSIVNFDPVLRPFLVLSEWFKGYIDERPYPNTVFRSPSLPNYDCMWLQRLPEYVWWKQEEIAVLFLYGGIGVGKTSLLSYALSLAQTQSKHSRSLVVALFCGSRKKQRLKLSDLWRQLQYELSVQMGEFPRVMELIRNSTITSDVFLAEELLLMGLDSCRVQIFIDLDDQEASIGREFLKWLAVVSSERGSGARMQIMISTRSHDTVHHSGIAWKRIFVHDVNREGIKNLVESRLKESKFSHQSKQGIVSHSRGSFLWTNLVLDNILTDEDVKSWCYGPNLRSRAWQDVMEHHFHSSDLEASDSSLSWRAWLCAWLMHAPESLTSEQMAATFSLWWCIRHEVHAITVISDTVLMPGLTSGLAHLTRRQERTVLELIHPATRHYVDRLGWVDEDTEREYLTFPFRWLEHATLSPSKDMLEHTFTQYVCQHFPSFVSYFASCAIRKSAYKSLFLDIDWDQSVLYWLQARESHRIADIDLQPDSSTKLVHIAAICALDSLISDLDQLSYGASIRTKAHLDLECKDSLGRTPLALATIVKDEVTIDKISQLILEKEKMQKKEIQQSMSKSEEDHPEVAEDQLSTEPVAVRAFSVDLGTSSWKPKRDVKAAERPSESEKSTSNPFPRPGSKVAMPAKVSICCECSTWNAAYGDREISCFRCAQPRCPSCIAMVWCRSGHQIKSSWSCCKCMAVSMRETGKCSDCGHERCEEECPLGDSIVVESSVVSADVGSFYMNKSHESPEKTLGFYEIPEIQYSNRRKSF